MQIISNVRGLKHTLFIILSIGLVFFILSVVTVHGRGGGGGTGAGHGVGADTGSSDSSGSSGGSGTGSSDNGGDSGGGTGNSGSSGSDSGTSSGSGDNGGYGNDAGGEFGGTAGGDNNGYGNSAGGEFGGTSNGNSEANNDGYGNDAGGEFGGTSGSSGSSGSGSSGSSGSGSSGSSGNGSSGSSGSGSSGSSVAGKGILDIFAGIFGNRSTVSTDGKGFIGRSIDAIAGFVSGLFSGRATSSDDSTGNDNRGSERLDENKTVIVSIDLVPVAYGAKRKEVNIEFMGLIKTLSDSATTTETEAEDNRETIFPTTSSGNSNFVGVVALSNTLMVDYGCNGSTDLQQDFRTSYKSTDTVTSMETSAKTIPSGEHCFAFKIDTSNDVNEKNEKNNQTEWKKFDPDAGILPDETVTVSCPIYMAPQCADNEMLYVDKPTKDGCGGAPYCAVYLLDDNESTTSADIMFEVKAFTLSDATGSGVQTRITTQDWSSNDIILSASEQLAFRWDASAYKQCLVYLYPEKYVFDTGVTSITGNTETLGVELRTLTQEYKVQCSNGDNTIEKIISVTAQ